MKNKNLRKYSSIILVILFASSFTIQAQQFRRGERPQPKQEQQRGQQGEEMNKKGPQGPHIPNLSEEQKEQMKAFRIDFEKAALPIRNEVGEKEARLRTLVSAENYDERAANKVIEEIGELKTDLMKLEVAQMQKVKSILTDEQALALNRQGQKGPRGGDKGRPGNASHHGRGR